MGPGPLRLGRLSAVKRYPLRPALEQRLRETEHRAALQGEAVQASLRANAILERARQHTKDLEEGLVRGLHGEAERGEQGQLRASDMARAEAFRREAIRRIDASRTVERAAERQLAALSSEEADARAALTASRADERAIREHAERFLRDERRREEEREAEDALARHAHRSRSE